MKSKNGIATELNWRRSPIPFNNLDVFDKINTTNHEGLSRSLQFMAHNYTKPIQLNEVVAASGMSRRGFVKAFTRHVGRAPGSFMRQARIEFAKRLLIEQDLPLRSIAAIIGFRSENTLCIAFHRATGMAPKKFQRHAWLSAYSTTGSQQISNSINSQ